MFSELPPELTGRSTIEQKLVYPRHEFMNIRSLGRERQQGLHGMVVNIPINTEQSVISCPGIFHNHRPFNCSCFAKLSYNNHIYMRHHDQELEAARYLSTTELCKQQKLSYQRNGIVL